MLALLLTNAVSLNGMNPLDDSDEPLLGASPLHLVCQQPTRQKALL